MNLNNIPNELKAKAVFCVWRFMDGRGKVPFNPVTKTHAKSNNKNTFIRYEDVIKYLPEYERFNESGVQVGGLGLGIFNGFSAIDIDDCRDVKTGILSDIAQDIVEFCRSYTEVSPSGTGIRIILKTPTIINKSTHYINNRNIGLEIYISENTSKYVTLTGNVLLHNEISEVDLSYVVEKYMKKNVNQEMPPTVVIDGESELLGDYDQRLQRALRYNAKLREVWTKKAPGSGSDESETDLSLCNRLAFIFEGNYNAIETAFQSSPYYQSKDVDHKTKWLHSGTYREDTLKKAITAFHQFKLQQVTEFEFSDTGNAHRFVKNFQHMVRFNVDNKQWMVFNGSYWQHDYRGQIKNMTEVIIEEMKHEVLSAVEPQRKEMARNIKRVLSSVGKDMMLRESQHLPGIPVINADFDIEPHLFNCKSGVIDLRTGDVRPADRQHMLSKFSNVEISKEKPVLWLKFLNEIFKNDAEMIAYIQKIIGYSLTGYTKEQSIFILHGDGSNGKSLLLETVNKIIGTYATTSSVDILVDRKNHSSNMSEIARLRGIRFVVTDETETGDRLKEAAIKSMTSDHGEITARFLYGNEFTFKPIFKILMATNHKPIIRGTDHGIWRRIKMIPFDVIIPDHKQDRNLGEKLAAEQPQILGWMIEGAVKWFNEGMKTPKTIDGAIGEYRSEMDLIQRWMNECCELDDAFATPAKDLFKNVTQYLNDNKEYPLSNTLFGRNLGKKLEKRKIGNVLHYMGIKLRTQSLVDLIDQADYADDMNVHDI